MPELTPDRDPRTSDNLKLPAENGEDRLYRGKGRRRGRNSVIFETFTESCTTGSPLIMTLS